MQPIAVIAPEHTSYEIIQRVAVELGIQDRMRLNLTGLSQSLAVARQAEADGACVIVARGWSANQIVESSIRTPVVFLPVSMQDMVNTLERALRQTSKARPKIGFIAFQQLESELEAISRMLQIDLRVYLSRGTREAMRETVLKAIGDGMDVLVGGETPAATAAEQGMPFQILISGETSIRQALSSAERMVYARELEQAHTLKFSTVVEYSRDGVVSLDAQGRVLLINPAAQRMLRLQNDITGRFFHSLLPLPGLDNCLSLGKRVMDEVVRVDDRPLLFSAIPIHVTGVVMGAIISFQEPRAIAAQESRLRRDSGLTARYTFADIHGASAALAQALDRARKFAASRHSVLIYGETGTGKEMFAQSIHNASSRRDSPFVAINCGALPRTLLESELFGYERGAFTGASSKGKAGLFELADGGTIFLDEIAELDLHAQQRLLRVLEERHVMRLSGTRPIHVDVRLIAATNADLWERVRRNRFRADLYYRLSVLLLRLPPLRERGDDVVVLARHFMSQSEENADMPQTFDEDALRVLRDHPWLGNVRELYYFVQRLCAAASRRLDAAALRAELLPVDTALQKDADPIRTPASLTEQQAVLERESIARALRDCDGRQGRAADLLGVDRSTLFRKMRRLGLK